MVLRFLFFITLIYIVSAKVTAEDAVNFNVSNKVKMEEIISIIEAEKNNKSDELFVMSSLESLKNIYPAEVNYRLGQIYYFGTFGIKGVRKSVEYFSIASSMNHLGSNYVLGSILVNHEYEMDDAFEKGVDYLEKASNGNISDAMFNLYSLYRKGMYPKEKAIYWLDKSASIGYERAVIFSAYEKYLLAVENGSKEQVQKIVDGLLNYEFMDFSGERYFFVGTMFSDEKSPIFNNKLRLKYLRISADAGYEQAQVILKEYNKLVELENH